jgi:hypothetical protein
MSLPRKQNSNEGDRLVVPPEAAKFSRLSAKMVELSLQRGQNHPILHGARPDKLNAVSSPLPWPSTSTFAATLPPPPPQGTPRESGMPKYWKEICCSLDYWLARARVSGSDVVRKSYEHTKSLQRRFSVWNLKSHGGSPSRLWTSSGLAASVAILAVGVISGARHYAYRSYMVQHGDRNTAPATPAIQDMSRSRSGSTVDANGAAAATPQPRSSTAGESRIRKIRVRKHDDYVARDTYVYYGNKGEPAK